MPSQLSQSFRSLATIPSDRKALAPRAIQQPSPDIFASANTTSLAVGKTVDHLSTFAGAEAIDWVWDCVTLISETLSRAEFHFEKDGEIYVPTSNPSDAKDQKAAPEDLATLTTRPNPYATWTDLVNLLVIDWLLLGNSFWLRHKPDSAGKPQGGLYRLMPQYLQIVPGKRQLVDAFLYTPPGRAQPIVYKPEDVIHFKRPNPHSEYLGAGVVKGGARVFDMEIALTRTLTEYFEQGTRLSGVLESDRGVPRDVWKRTKAQFMALYAGAANSYKVAMLTHGMKFKPIQATAAEAEFRFLTEVSRDRILAMFRVPGPLLGITAGFDRQAVREAQRIFDNKTVRPIADALQSAISLALTQAWDLDFVIDYEYEMPVEDAVELAVDFATLPGVTVAEVRNMAGLKPLGPDKKDPTTKEPIDNLILNLPGSDDNDSDVKDRGLGSEPGRPPKPENTRAFPTDRERAPGATNAKPKNVQAVAARKSFEKADAALARAEAALAAVE